MDIRSSLSMNDTKARLQAEVKMLTQKKGKIS